MKNFIIAGITFLSIVSCRQDPAPAPQATDCKLATAFFDVTGSPTFTVVHSNNKISAMNSSTKSVSYSYATSGMLSKKEYFYNSVPDYKYEYTESNGKITEQKMYEYNGTSYDYYGKAVFTYNSGKLQQINYYDASNVPEEYATYVWTGDNVTEIKTYLANGNFDCSILYSYDLAKTNDFNTIYPDFEFQNVYEQDYLDVRFISKNVVTNTTYCNGSLESFSNTFTAQNLMDKVTGANGVDIYRFTYNCQ